MRTLLGKEPVAEPSAARGPRVSGEQALTTAGPQRAWEQVSEPSRRQEASITLWNRPLGADFTHQDATCTGL